MDKAEARQLLEAALAELRAKSWSELERLIGAPDAYSVQGKSGTRYQMEKQAFWDDKKGEDLRVMVSIDDGGWRSMFPMSVDFIMAPNGSFVGE
ncbi:MAG: hypothetical protein M3Z28_01385 [Candidatus Dormibacteraeota bacterium]|nr:hypothetical protein [Candidatus Dormibacteraeota bacterium]